MADRYNNINNTSPYESALKNSNKAIPMSNFDYSKAHYGNMNIGTLEILDCFETLPQGKYTLSMDLLLKVRVAMKKRIMTGQRVFVHAYYMSLNDLWEGAQNHIDHGRSGLLDIEKPYTTGFFKAFDIDSNDYRTTDYDWFSPNSVFNQLGVPVRFYQNTNPSLYWYAPVNLNDFKEHQRYETKVNALPAAMYQRIYLEKYAPKNLLQTNNNAYPENAEKIRIAYNITELNALNAKGGDDCQNTITSSNFNDNIYLDYYSDQSSFNTSVNGHGYILDKFHNNSIDSDITTAIGIGIKRYRQKKGDYFTTSSPFADLLRGDAPTIDLAGFSANVDFSDVVAPATTITTTELLGVDTNSKTILAGLFDGTNLTHSDRTNLLEALNKAKVSGNVQTQATANMLRNLVALTLIKERNALTNGDYNAMVKAQFGYSPNVDDYGPKYIGGFYQDIIFSDVTQTSESSNSSPLGNQSGQAMSANSGYIGKFTAPDYGYIMILASIVPDNIYAQGLPRYLSDLSSDDVYTSPLLNNLPPQPIKNKEIFLTSTESINEDVFSYTQRYEHLRHRENQASGLVAMKRSLNEDSSYIQMKKFDSSPQFNAKFVDLCPDNVDMTVYDVVNEPPYIFTAISRVDKVEPLPYDSLPADFGFNF